MWSPRLAFHQGVHESLCFFTLSVKFFQLEYGHLSYHLPFGFTWYSGHWSKKEGYKPNIATIPCLRPPLWRNGLSSNFAPMMCISPRCLLTWDLPSKPATASTYQTLDFGFWNSTCSIIICHIIVVIKGYTLAKIKLRYLSLSGANENFATNCGDASRKIALLIAA